MRLLKCPNSDNHKKFKTTAHIVQSWLVNEEVDYIETVEESLAVASYPDIENIYICSTCGAEADIYDK